MVPSAWWRAIIATASGPQRCDQAIELLSHGALSLAPILQDLRHHAGRDHDELVEIERCDMDLTVVIGEIGDGIDALATWQELALGSAVLEQRGEILDLDDTERATELGVAEGANHALPPGDVVLAERVFMPWEKWQSAPAFAGA